MEKIGVKRYKNHQVLISKEVYFYIQKVRMEYEENVSSEDISDNDEALDSLNESIDSEILDEKFQKVEKKRIEAEREADVEFYGEDKSPGPNDIDPAVNEPTVEQLEEELNNNIDTANSKFLERRRKFDNQFEETLKNFNMNMDFMAIQQSNVKNLVRHSQMLQMTSINSMKAMNSNIKQVLTNITRVE